MLKRALRKRGYKLIRTDMVNVLEFLLHRVLSRKKLTFVQIGANDGRTADPLYEFVTHHHERLNGVVVEPVRDYFDELVRNYAAFANIVPVNAAIHRTAKEMTIYRVDPRWQRTNPRLRKGIASFDPTHYRRTGTPVQAMIAEQVRCLSLEELLREQRIRDLDLLQIDVEGYDAEIIRSIPFERVRPQIIRFEHGRFATMPREDFRDVRALLRHNGYDLMIEANDATAYLPDVVLDLSDTKAASQLELEAASRPS